MRFEDIGSKELDRLWSERSAHRSKLLNRWKYYQGQHSILGQNKVYSHGGKKSERVMNWCKYGVDMYVGALTDSTLQVSSKGSDKETAEPLASTPTEYRLPEGIAFYQSEFDRLHLAATDSILVRDMLIQGFSVELHEYSEQAIVITRQDPLQWGFVRDETGEVALAYRIYDVPAGSFFGGAYVKESFRMMTVYDRERIVDLKSASDAGWVEHRSQEHFYNSVPVVVWEVLEDGGQGLLTDDVLKLNDEYNEIYSARGDDIRFQTDAKMKTWGMDPEYIKENQNLIREMGIIPMMGDRQTADAEYMSRPSNAELVKEHLGETRENIHNAMSVPDVATIVGATGGTSGIALQLKFQPMQHRAGFFKNQIHKAIRKRIELMNSRSEKSSRPLIEDYQITVAFSIPVNKIEEWQNISKLDGEVSHRTRLEFLTDIHDPERELSEVMKEKNSQPAASDQPEGAQEESFNRLADATAARLEPIFQTMADEISTIALKAFNKSGIAAESIKEPANQTA